MDRRGLSGAIDAFELGYAQWDWLVKEMPYPTDKVERVLDKFIFDKRLVIPIHDADGDVVGFAGRSLSDNNKRKYLNSRSSGVYLKNRILYNLHRIEGKKVYVVEGYPDVWRLHLSGYQAVAPCGTAFTREHLDILHERGITQIVFCFDGDKAGLEASERAKKLIANDNRFRYAFKFMPYKIDPDELIRIQGASAFEAVEEEVIQEPHERILSLMIDRVVDLEAKLEDGIRDEGFQIEWPVFSSKMDGIQRGLHLVGGLSNVGKTSFMLRIFKQLAEHNAELIPVYFSIDDDWKTIYHRLLAAAANITIAQARDPVKHIRNNPKMSDMAREEYMERRKEGRLKLYHLFKRAPVLDIADAKRLDDFENTVRILKEHTGKELAIFIDNFHKIRDERFKSTNERFTRLSEELKRITVEYGLVTFATVELRKLNHKGRPSLDDIKESVDIIYDAQAIYMLHNDYHSKFGNTRFCFEWGGGVHPVIEMTVAKNKLTEFKGRIYYQFIPERAIYTECNMQDQIRFQKLAAEVGEDG
jgi:DNA primase